MKVQSKLVNLKNGLKATLRSAEPSDAEDLLSHLRISGAEAYRNLNHPPSHWDGVSVEAEQKMIAEFESSAGKFMLVAVVNDRIIGGLGMFGAQGEFLKHNASLGMGIQQKYCNTGVGTALIRYALEAAKSAGLTRISLTVRTYNDGGIALYEKCGFERVGFFKNAAFIDGQYVDEFAYQILLD